MLHRSEPVSVAPSGAVGGVDIGWSTVRRSSAAARLSWDDSNIHLIIERFRAVDAEREAALRRVFHEPVSVAAFDGPLTTGLVALEHYRLAEQMLTAGFQPLIGKPGQSSSRNGRLLNCHANICALLMIGSRLVSTSAHKQAIHHLAVVEAFPTSFLGVLVETPEGLKSRSKSTSDVFFSYLEENRTLEQFLKRLLPGRTLGFEIGALTNHDDRAAFICALTALCVAANDYTAVGDMDGWIILPPFDLVRPWAHRLFERNAVRFGYVQRSGVERLRLGWLNGMYPPMTLEQFDADNEEIAKLFYGGELMPDTNP